MDALSTLADDFYVNCNLNTEMRLPEGRETTLQFFERVRKKYDSMRNFYTRDNGDFVLEEDKEDGRQRWVTLEPRRVCSGYINPADVDDAMEQHTLILQQVPYMLSISPLDCEALDYMLGFDFTYRGNHDELVAEALGAGPAVEPLTDLPGCPVLNYEPAVTIGLDEECRLQARLTVETRTNAYQVRKNDFPEDQISVYFTVRQYGSLDAGVAFEERLITLREHCDRLLEEHVIEAVLRPLSHAIAAK